jgi:hypothetical protein
MTLWQEPAACDDFLGRFSLVVSRAALTQRRSKLAKIKKPCSTRTSCKNCVDAKRHLHAEQNMKERREDAKSVQSVRSSLLKGRFSQAMFDSASAIKSCVDGSLRIYCKTRNPTLDGAGVRCRSSVVEHSLGSSCPSDWKRLDAHRSNSGKPSRASDGNPEPSPINREGVEARRAAPKGLSGPRVKGWSSTQTPRADAKASV